MSTGGSITSVNGAISVTGTYSGGATPAAGIALGASGGSGQITSSGNANITLTTDSFSFDQNGTINASTAINAGTGTVAIQNKTAGVKINLGGADVLTAGSQTLGLSAAELAKVTAGNVVIGQTGANASGTLTVSDNLSLANGAKILSGGDIVVATGKTITATGAGKAVILNSNSSGIANSTGAIVMNSGSGITTNNGNITLGGGSTGDGSDYALGNATNPNGILFEGASLLSTGGNISLRGKSHNSTTQYDFRANGIRLRDALSNNVINSGSGQIALDGVSVATGVDSAYGVELGQYSSTNTTQLISSSNAATAINLTGTGGANAANIRQSGVYFNVKASASASGTGGVNITATGGGVNGAVTSQAFTTLSGSTITSNNAAISVTADSVDIQGTLNAGTSTVTLQNRTAGTTIDVGGTSADVVSGSLKLGVSSAELAKITAGTVVVGRNDGTADSGNVIANAINMGALGNTSGNLTVLSGNDITVSSALTKNAGSAASLVLTANNGITINAAVGSTTNAINVNATAKGNSSTDSKGVYLSGSGSINTAGTVVIDATSRKTNGWDFTKSALAASTGASIKGSSVDIKLLVDLASTNRVYGLFAQNGTSFEATSGNLKIDATLKGAGGLLIGGNTFYSGAILLGSNTSSPGVSVKATGDVTLTSTMAANSSASNTGVNLVDTGVQAGGNVLIQSTVADASTKAIALGDGGAGLGFSAISSSNAGNITIQSNQGSIAVTGLTSPSTGVAGLSGKNVTIDNTGGTLTTDATTGAITLAQGSGVASVGPGVSLGQKTVSSAAAVMASKNINIVGGNSAATSNGVSIQSSMQAANNVIVSGVNTSASNTAPALYIDKAVSSTSGTITLTADVAGSTIQALQLNTGASLVTSNNAITLNSDSIDINTSATPATINAGTGTVSLQNKSAGVLINVGGSDVGATTSTGRTLGLTNNELNQITAAELVIGQKGTSTASGNVTVSSAVTSKTTTGNLTLNTGGNVDVNANLTVGDTTRKNLTLNAAGNVNSASTARATADAVRINVGGSVGTSYTNRFQTSANSLVIESVGDQLINELDGTRFAGVTTSGEVNVVSNTGSISVDKLTAADGVTDIKGITTIATGKKVTLVATVGAVYSSTGNGDSLITTDSLKVKASDAIGTSTSKLQTNVNFLASESGSDQFIAETNAVTLAAKSTAGSVNISTSNGAMAVGNLYSADGATSVVGVSAKTGVSLTTGSGNLTVGEAISNSTSGNIVLAAGTSKLAGDASTGNDIQTASGKTVSNSATGGMTYLYTGTVANTGKLSDAVSSLSTLYLSSIGANKLNAVSNTAYTSGNAAAVATGDSTQVFFREALNLGAVSLGSSTVSKTYGDVAYSNLGTLSTEVINQIKLTNTTSGTSNTFTASATGAATAIKISASDLIDSLNIARTYIDSTDKSSAGFLNANASGYAYSLSAGSKYAVTLSGASANVVVAKKALTGSITQGHTTYGSPLVAGTVSLTNKLGTDDVSASGVAVDTAGKTSTSGNLKAADTVYSGIQSVTGLSGVDAGNYSFADVKGDYKVDRLALTG
ncbi:MAG: beta strand repeat-containing protein, partial [Rhodoluna sp.]